MNILNKHAKFCEAGTCDRTDRNLPWTECLTTSWSSNRAASHGHQHAGRHRGEGGAGGALAPPLFWLIKLLFQFFSKVLHKKVHRVILCQTCGPQRKHCFLLIAPFQSNIVFWRFSWCLSRQFAEFLVRSRRLDFRLPNNEFQAPVYIFASSGNGVSRRH